MIELLKALETKRKETSQTAIGQAQVLGLHESMFHMLRSGKRKPGVKTLGAILRVYPDLAPLVQNYLAWKEDGDEANC